jgi:hypothetical protein
LKAGRWSEALGIASRSCDEPSSMDPGRPFLLDAGDTAIFHGTVTSPTPSSRSLGVPQSQLVYDTATVQTKQADDCGGWHVCELPPSRVECHAAIDAWPSKVRVSSTTTATMGATRATAISRFPPPCRTRPPPNSTPSLICSPTPHPPPGTPPSAFRRYRQPQPHRRHPRPHFLLRPLSSSPLSFLRLLAPRGRGVMTKGLTFLRLRVL